MRSSNHKPLRVAIGAIVVAGVVTPNLQADLVTFAFAGQIIDIRNDNDLLPDNVSSGMPFSGTYTFEGDTPGMPAAGAFGDTIYDAITDVTGHASGIPFDLGNHPVTPSRDGIIVGDFSSGSAFVSDTYRLLAPVSFAGFEAFFFLDLFDSQNRMFQDDSLPIVPPQLQLTSSRQMSIGEVNQGFFVISRVDKLELVPEPSTAVLLLAFSAMLSLRRQGRRPWTVTR